MSQPCKIVTFTPEQRDAFRKLRDAAAAAEKAFNDFKTDFEKRNAPATRRYAPFEKIAMEVLDDPTGPIPGGTMHAWFTKELE